MSSFTLVTGAIFIFIIVALLYLQSKQPLSSGSLSESFVDLQRETWNPSQLPIAGRFYDPGVPADLNRVTSSSDRTILSGGTIPLSQQRSTQIPTGGSQTMPRQSLAQLKDLRELDSKIVTWLNAANQKDRESPGSLTLEQKQKRIILSARLNEIRDQIGTGVITDSWASVSNETRKLRDENASWGQIAPSLDNISSFGASSGAADNTLLSTELYSEFYSLFNSAIQEMQGLAQPDPLQKVRLQQLQMIRQELMDYKSTHGGKNPPIQMRSAKQFLQQMLKPDQPLPSIIDTSSSSVESTPIFWTIQFPTFLKGEEGGGAGEDLKNSTMNPGSGDLKNSQRQGRQVSQGSQWDPFNLQKRATVLCSQIREAFDSEDAIALGCPPKSHSHKISDNYEAETIINTVCNRLRYSVPSIDPEQFGCPNKNV